MLKEGMFIQGRYEIVGKIGTGGMADVYKAKDHKLNRFVAVKVLKPEFREDKAFISKFRAEAQAAAGLAHPNIVNIYDVGEDHGVNFIVMELVEGITLKEYIEKKGKLAVREATSIAIQVSQGLEAAHNSGIIHRDVKPQNIIISTDGKVKVTDFGIARAASSNTISSTVMGSVHYSSPEQARGGYSDAKSDIYSLGISLYEMLTGRVPFDGDTTVAIAIKHLQEEMKSPEVYVPDLPRSTVQIINKCTQKSPDRRYANMAELIRDLKESLINPDGDFVKMISPGGGRTVVISREELGAIKEGYHPTQQSSAPEGYQQGNRMARMSSGPSGMAGQTGPSGPANGMDRYGNPSRTPVGYQQPPMGGQGYPGGMQEEYDPYAYGRAYGKRGYNYSEEMDEGGFREDEDDRGLLNPRLEKIMTVGSIVIAVLIACIFLGLIANALGLFKFSLPSLFGKTKTTEAVQKTTDSEKTTGSLPSSSWTGQTDGTVQTPVTETQVTEEPVVTESQTEAPVDIMDPGTAPIPNVTGKTYDEAVNELMSAGFYVEKQVDPSDTVPTGQVMNQSMSGEAKLGSTVILVVSGGPEQTGNTDSGVWLCNAQLDVPANYNGEIVRLELVQGDQKTVITEGSAISFPYDVSTVQGQPGVSAGQFDLYLYNEVTGTYDLYASYPVTFSQVQ